MEVQIRTLAWMEMGMVSRSPQPPGAGVTAAGTTRAEAAEGADCLPGVAEGAALEQTEAHLKDRYLHVSVLPLSVRSLMRFSLPAVTVGMAQAAEVEELSLLR